MNYWLVLASALSLLTCGVHIFAGGREIHTPMIASALHPVMKAIWSVVWHAVTIIMLMNAVAFLYAAQNPDTAWIVSIYPIVTSLACAGLFLFYGVARLGSI